jgi:hypothetical protein
MSELRAPLRGWCMRRSMPNCGMQGDQDAHTAPEPLPPDPAPPSTGVLRFVGGPQRVQLPTQRHRYRHLALRAGRHGPTTTTVWRTLRLLPPAHLWTVVNIRVHPAFRRAGAGGCAAQASGPPENRYVAEMRAVGSVCNRNSIVATVNS